MQDSGPYAPRAGQSDEDLALEVLAARQRALADLAEAAGRTAPERLVLLQADAAGFLAGLRGEPAPEPADG